ncbi:MAG: hypothetical protein JSW45_01845, partial [Thiotrichales bacterium]
FLGELCALARVKDRMIATNIIEAADSYANCPIKSEFLELICVLCVFCGTKTGCIRVYLCSSAD